MKTMGFGTLILADCPEFDAEKVRMMAVHAFDVYENAGKVVSLGQALSDSVLSAGFTRRKGERRKELSYPVREFARLCAARPPGPLSLVFGNEKDGLTDAELAECTYAVHIPTSEAFPSLNVAQAVQIACHEFFSLSEPGAPPRKAKAEGFLPASRALIDEQVDFIAETLAKAGFFRKTDDSHARHFLREICEKAALSSVDVKYLGKLFAKAVALGDRSEP
jgi:tRNA/rRNA methyltransferase